MLTSHITPTKSTAYESKVESPHVTSTKPHPVKEEKASSKGASETASGSEDILETLASRINQLAASDSEDDLFSGMFLLMYDLQCVYLVSCGFYR